MNDLKAIIIGVVGAIFTLLAPIQNFMYAMLILFGLNFGAGLLAAYVNKEPWDNKKALWFFVYVAIFLVSTCSAFIIGYLMDEREQSIAVVKILCFIAIYIFGTNIFRNLRFATPTGSPWYKFFDLCYYVLSVKFIEKFDFMKKWQKASETSAPSVN